MKGKVVLVGLVTMVMLSMTAFQGAANVLYEDSVFVEGVGLDGLDVTTGDTYYDTDGDGIYETVTTVTTGAAKNVMVGWSDDIIYHQFPAGQKVRTEVLLHVVQIDSTGAITSLYTVYTITAHFKIEAITSGGGLPFGDETIDQNVLDIYSSSIAEGLWTDGSSDAYTAEVNDEGNLLYGYNWDTRGFSSGWYRLTFWIEDDDCPSTIPETTVSISYPGVDICYGDPTDVEPNAVGFVGYNFDTDTTWLDLFLTSKPTGRGQSG